MIKKYFQLDRKHIVTVQFIIEGYEAMATVTTMDSRQAIIRISIMTDYVPDMTGLLEYLKTKYKMQEVIDYHR
jgi:ABC-type tungstate transport system permease subunit